MQIRNEINSAGKHGDRIVKTKENTAGVKKKKLQTDKISTELIICNLYLSTKRNTKV